MDERLMARLVEAVENIVFELEERLENLQESVNLIDRRTEQMLARLTAADMRKEEYPPDFPARADEE